ncbi:MAG TPA: ATP synthase F1 subunit delta [Nitrospira sp.]
MIKTTVARRYAQALFELLGPSNTESTRHTLASLAQSLRASTSLRHVVVSPAFGVDEKIAVLTALAERLGCPAEAKAFLGQLVKKNRVTFLPEIAEAFSKLVDQSKGTQQVTVSSASVLLSSEQERIKTRLRDALKREVEVTFHTDPGHMAGLQIHMGSRVVDSTVRSRLSTMRTVLTRE